MNYSSSFFYLLQGLDKYSFINQKEVILEVKRSYFRGNCLFYGSYFRALNVVVGSYFRGQFLLSGINLRG
ncbi:MAG: hypothetical protein L0Y61_04625 [Epsilonproteobacteria bacterium]|nr:hypothetical protein [Campylobacterota bacterium]